MRPLTEDESKAVFTKLANYIVRACFISYQLSIHLPFILGEKSHSLDRQTGRTVLLQTSKGSSVLCL